MSTSLDKELHARAPHLDEAWVSDFVVALRLRGASGAAVGAAVLEAESHVANAGVTAYQVFGEPRDYASALDLPDTQQWTPGEVAHLFTQVVLFMLAAVVLTAGVTALWTGQQARLSLVPILAGLGVTTLAFVALTVRGSVVLQAAVERPRWGLAIGAAGFVAVGGAVAVSATIDGPVLHIPGWCAIVGAALCLLAWVAAWAWRVRRGAGLEDPITFPVA